MQGVFIDWLEPAEVALCLQQFIPPGMEDTLDRSLDPHVADGLEETAEFTADILDLFSQPLFSSASEFQLETLYLAALATLQYPFKIRYQSILPEMSDSPQLHLQIPQRPDTFQYFLQAP